MEVLSAGVDGVLNMSGVRRVVSCRRIYDPEAPELQASLLKPQLSGNRSPGACHTTCQCSCVAHLYGVKCHTWHVVYTEWQIFQHEYVLETSREWMLCTLVGQSKAQPACSQSGLAYAICHGEALKEAPFHTQCQSQRVGLAAHLQALFLRPSCTTSRRSPYSRAAPACGRA